MRKLFATTLVALLALTMVLAAVGCGKKTETSTSESTPAMGQPSTDSSAMMSESTMTDTAMHK